MKYLLIILIISLLSCNDENITFNKRLVILEVEYLDKAVVDTITTLITRPDEGYYGNIDIYAADRPHPCLGIDDLFIACNVRTYKILKDTFYLKQ